MTGATNPRSPFDPENIAAFRGLSDMAMVSDTESISASNPQLNDDSGMPVSYSTETASSPLTPFASIRIFPELPITDLHVFLYSKRPGTPAATLADQIPGNISRDRAGRLRHLAAEKHRIFAESFIGQELEVVVETGTKRGLLKGISKNYLDIRFAGDASLAGQCVTLKPFSWQDDALRAELVLSPVPGLR